MNIINSIFPTECVGCNKKGEYICNNCKKKLISHPEECYICHKKSKGFKICFECKSKNKYIEGIIIGFNYTGILKKLILGIKYGHIKSYSIILAEKLYLNLITNELINLEDCILTYIPSHRYKKIFLKGYNQSYEICKELSNISGLKMYSLTKKIKFTKSQIKLNRKKRLINLKGSFKYNTEIILKGNETIIIIDDISTTGSTIKEVGKIIKNIYPNSNIRGAVLGRHT